jgi:hypothetical protein
MITVGSQKRALVFAVALAALFAVSGARAADKTLQYQLSVNPEAVKAKAGDKSTLKIVLQPQGSAHVDPRAPLSLQAKSGTVVVLDKTDLGHDDGKETESKGVEFAVPFTAKAAGADKIDVHADFFLCTAKICERQIADVSVPVTVE